MDRSSSTYNSASDADAAQVPQAAPPAVSRGSLINGAADGGGIERQASQVAEGLRTNIAQMIEHAVGVNPRAVTLSNRMGVSQSLAARVVRSIRADDAAGVFKDMPAPKGLGKLVGIAGDMGVGSEILTRAARSIDEFEALIDGIPTGRAGLHAAMAGVDQSTRERTVRDAAQSTFKSMTALLGYHGDQHVQTWALVPSREAPGRVDLGILLHKTGICRYRPSSRITVFGHSSNRADAQPRVETLDGVTDSADPRDYLLNDHCSAGVERIEIFKTDGLHLFSLPSDEPAMGSAVDFCSAFIVRDNHPRYATEHQRWNWQSVVPRIPVRDLTIHLLIHDDLKTGREPELTSSLHGLNASWERPDDPRLEFDAVEGLAELARVSVDERSMAVRGVPGYMDSLGTLLSSLDAGFSDFHGYRVDIKHPVPLIGQTLWVPLEEEPT